MNRSEHIEAGPDFAGLRIKLIQAGPREFVAAIETEWGEEVGRSFTYHETPAGALAHAIESIAAHTRRTRQ